MDYAAPSTFSDQSNFSYIQVQVNDLKACKQSHMTSSNPAKPKRVLIVGAGLVGSLASILFAQRGFDVTVVEKRPGIYFFYRK